MTTVPIKQRHTLWKDDDDDDDENDDGDNDEDDNSNDDDDIFSPLRSVGEYKYTYNLVVSGNFKTVLRPDCMCACQRQESDWIIHWPKPQIYNRLEIGGDNMIRVMGSIFKFLKLGFSVKVLFEHGLTVMFFFFMCCHYNTGVTFFTSNKTNYRCFP